jgi:MFS family permease
MMGLFMIFPVFALYAEHLEGTTPVLIGLAMGMYGLTQAIFQIPYGMISDRFGRKPVIVFGLLVFAAGSVVAAMSDTIWGVIFGRALQGAGAIAAVVMALTADLTREEKRLRAMAIIGASIGVAFMTSLVLGPVLDIWIGVDGIFWLTAVLAIVAIFVLKYWVPNPVGSRFHRDAMTAPAQLGLILRDRGLMRLNAGIFLLHMMLTATFVVLPLALRDNAGVAPAEHWTFYLPVMLTALLAMVPLVIIAEKQGRMKPVFLAAILSLGVAELVFLGFNRSGLGLLAGLFIYFAAFNVLEATLPSLVAKTVSPDNKGTAMGVYSTTQFLGAFIGGISGGTLHGLWGLNAVFGFCVIVALVWLVLAVFMQSPRHLSTHIIRVGDVDERRAQSLVSELTKVTGVAEAVVIVEDGIAYLKVDLGRLDREALQQFSVS